MREEEKRRDRSIGGTINIKYNIYMSIIILLVPGKITIPALWYCIFIGSFGTISKRWMTSESPTATSFNPSGLVVIIIVILRGGKEIRIIDKKREERRWMVDKIGMITLQRNS